MAKDMSVDVGFVGYSVEAKEKAQKLLSSITGKYTVLPVKKTWISDNPLLINPKKHDGAILFSNAEYVFCAPYINGIFHTGLTNEQQEAFEALMNLRPGTLSPYNSSYWGDYKNYIKIKKEGLKLDCDNVIIDKLRYLLLKSCAVDGGKVVLSEMEVEMNPMCELLVRSDEKEAEIASKTLAIKSKAFQRLVKSSLKDLRDYLRVYEKKLKVNESTKEEVINSAILSIVDNRPEEFLNNIENPSFKDFVFIEDLLENKILKQTVSGITTADGQLIGKTTSDAVIFLRSKENQDLKINLMARLEQIKGK